MNDQQYKKTGGIVTTHYALGLQDNGFCSPWRHSY